MALHHRPKADGGQQGGPREQGDPAPCPQVELSRAVQATNNGPGRFAVLKVARRRVLHRPASRGAGTEARGDA